MTEKISYALKPDAQPFDEIKIRIEPRWKSSELSGCEWRISAITEFYRKGKLIHETQSGGSNVMEVAAGLLFHRLVSAQDDGKGYFAGDGVHCDQEGCMAKAKYLMRLKKRFCVGPGNCGQEKKRYSDTPEHRCFCEKHMKRGDNDLEDNDDNYEMINVIAAQ